MNFAGVPPGRDFTGGAASAHFDAVTGTSRERSVGQDALAKLPRDERKSFMHAEARLGARGLWHRASTRIQASYGESAVTLRLM